MLGTRPWRLNIENLHIAPNWYGFYASRGAATDAIGETGWEHAPATCCPESGLGGHGSQGSP